MLHGLYQIVTNRAPGSLLPIFAFSISRLGLSTRSTVRLLAAFSGLMPPFPVLTGPTSVGKTALSVQLAQAMNAEIISADSRQVYRELTIGTAKPEADVLARVRHHFIDELDLGEPFSAGQFARKAEARMRAIMDRGCVPLIVGGSALYLHALIHGLADVPPVPPEVRTSVEARLAGEGAQALYQELERVDPASARTMDPTKTQRLVRALEVFHGTGRPLSFYHEAQKPPPFRYRVYILHRDRPDLYNRINRRVDLMLEAGLLDEVRGLLERGADPTANPLRTIGYQEAIAFLQGEVSYEEIVRLIKRNTRRYAKRQLTWFRRFPHFHWIDLASPAGVKHMLSLSEPE